MEEHADENRPEPRKGRGRGRGRISRSERLTEVIELSAAPPSEPITLNPSTATSTITSASSRTDGRTHEMVMRQRSTNVLPLSELQPPSKQDPAPNSSRGKSGRGRGRGQANNVSKPAILLPTKSSITAPASTKTNSKLTKANKNSVPMISSSVKLRLGAAPAAFGDVEDIFRDKTVNDEGGGTITYNIDVRRKFLPGNYILHIVKTPKTSKFASQYGVILCREDVDPVKIHDLITKSSYMTWDFRLSNGISRYDWKHFRNWGSFEYEKRKMEKQMKRKQKKRDDFDDFEGPPVRNFQQALEVLGKLAEMNRDVGYNPFWSPPSSPEPEPEIPKKTPEQIAHEAILYKFQTILLDYFMNKDKIVKQCTLFVDSGRIQEIAEGNFVITQDNDWVYIIRSTSNNGGGQPKSDEAGALAGEGGEEDTENDKDNILGFLIKERPNKAKTLIAGDWHHGCVLQDKSSQEYFGFVFGDCFENEGDEKHPNDIAAGNYIWDVHQLLLS